MTGRLAILNVGTGDTKLSFDKNNPAECIRAARIVTDMLRRGYALLVEVERNGVKGYQRIREFKEDTCEYIIADFDPVAAQKADEMESKNHEEQAEAPIPPEAAAVKKPRGRPPRTASRALPASTTKAVAIAPRAGG